MPDQKHNPFVEGISIVALGSFNPGILHPMWFVENGLLPKEEAEKATIPMVSTDIAIFKAAWFTFQAIDERWAIETSDPTKDLSLRDLAAGMIDVLSHTPIYAFGFNLNQHFAMQPRDRSRLGSHFVPYDNWTNLIKDAEVETLVMKGRRQHCDSDSVSIKFEPSKRVQNGTFIQVNQHYAARELDGSKKNRTADFLRSLKDEWSGFVNYAKETSNKLLSQMESVP